MFASSTKFEGQLHRCSDALPCILLVSNTGISCSAHSQWQVEALSVSKTYSQHPRLSFENCPGTFLYQFARYLVAWQPRLLALLYHPSARRLFNFLCSGLHLSLFIAENIQDLRSRTWNVTGGDKSLRPRCRTTS